MSAMVTCISKKMNSTWPSMTLIKRSSSIPSAPRAIPTRGLAYLQKGELDKALADFSRAIQLNPKDGPSRANRGIAYARQGDLDKAITELTESIRLEPGDVSAYDYRGKARLQKVKRKTPSPISPGQSSSIPGIPRVTAAERPRTSRAVRWTRPSPISTRQSASIQTMPQPTTIADPLT